MLIWQVTYNKAVFASGSQITQEVFFRGVEDIIQFIDSICQGHIIVIHEAKALLESLQGKGRHLDMRLIFLGESYLRKPTVDRGYPCLDKSQGTYRRCNIRNMHL